MGQLSQEEINVDLFNEVKRFKKEIKKRQKYEEFLKSQIRCGNDLDDNHTFEWFCELWGDVLLD